MCLVVYGAVNHRDTLEILNKNDSLHFGLVEHICGAQSLLNSVLILFDQPSYTIVHGLMPQNNTAVIILNVAILQQEVTR
jgi:hypothetical protein